MIIIRTNILPLKKYDAMNFFGLLFVHHGVYLSADLINHERIHTYQMKEMGFFFFYLWYVIEWLIRIPMKGRAYKNISFEREAYAEMANSNYLKQRKPYAWIKYLRQK
ncbi:MAG: hypothetical protein E6507_07325 [Prevotella bivia]|uniref:DUF4157 domain-containing protein n=2 Tax=Prevotella bivia TaxID=28125 RepID=I4ZBY8_9BACT|nr:hypothetical protein [Prevotella bivia]EFB93256.1 hypothetical protein HMPREF0648_0976 [Prevotella bivia JCVIHMP010]EIM33730.1 hypothetical protein PrebiDRAFT_2064 [Prevotella bivia DSM 20514]KGF23056.1 membrane protein [Prevotella bivia DNF00188]KXO18122.1 hypothetical protein HMPREF3202_00462 [Prevotella bivia]MDK7762585.1 hypothetical protein [Prevotella bivia]